MVYSSRDLCCMKLILWPKRLIFARFCRWISFMSILLVDGEVNFSRIDWRFRESWIAFLVSCQFCRTKVAQHRFIDRNRSLKNIIFVLFFCCWRFFLNARVMNYKVCYNPTKPKKSERIISCKIVIMTPSYVSWRL